MRIEIHPIGVIRTPLTTSQDTPIQPSFSDILGEVILEERYVDGVKSLDGFSHIILLYWFHRSSPYKLLVRPYLDNREHGLFSTRAPSRPNPIGLSIVELLTIEGNRLRFKGADMLDETPLLDIKPFAPHFDHRDDTKCGWLDSALKEQDQKRLADDRFEEE